MPSGKRESGECRTLYFSRPIRRGKKQDVKEVEAIARQFGMDEEARRDFGDFIEECKREGDRGSKNDRGDFTWEELEQRAREFLGQGPAE